MMEKVLDRSLFRIETRELGYWNSIKEGIVIQYNLECVRVDYNGGLSYLMSDSQSLSQTPDL